MEGFLIANPPPPTAEPPLQGGLQGSDYIKIKIDSPPSLQGREAQQIQSLHAYLFRLAQMLNIALDSLSGQSGTQSVEQSMSPKAIYNSIRRLICASGELFDSAYQNLLPRFSEIFLSLKDFRQFSTKMDDSFAAADERLLDAKSELTTKIDNVSASIPNPADAVSNFVEGTWTVRKWESGFAEVFGSVDSEQTEHSLPISFLSAVVIPEGSVEGSVLTVPQGSGSILILGKESK